MSSDEENKEVTVKAPSKPTLSPEKQAEKEAQKALETERFGVLQFPQKISRYLGFTAGLTGIVLVCLSIYMSATGQTGGILLSLNSGSLSLLLWGFVGILNVAVGFLFLGRD